MALPSQHDYEKMYRRYLKERNLVDPLTPSVGSTPKAPGPWTNVLNDVVAAQDFEELRAKHEILEAKYEELLKTAFYLEGRIRALEETTNFLKDPIIQVDPVEVFDPEKTIDD